MQQHPVFPPFKHEEWKSIPRLSIPTGASLIYCGILAALGSRGRNTSNIHHCVGGGDKEVEATS